MKRPVVLVILDGWGIGPENDANPIHAAEPERFLWIEANYPVTSLQASGISVGLPWGEVGNSEVGHLTLGAGKVVYQYFPRITIAIQNKTFFENAVFKDAFAHARASGGTMHLAGLLTKGNVHAALDHLLALIAMGEREGVPVKLHLWADGKDSAPRTLEELLRKVPREKMATLIGRYYAMNRSGNWSLTEKAYACMMGTGGELVASPEQTIKNTYARNLSEEFLPPLRLGDGRGIEAGDALIFFNFREDSMVQTIQPFAFDEFDRFPRVKPANLFLATMTQYAENLSLPVAFPPDLVERPLGRVLSDAGKTQLRLAESYKHAHVTFFFNGHRETPYPNEYRVLIPSLKAAHPDEHPELQAVAVTDRLIEVVQNQSFDFVLANYSNPDTIAHTGNYPASVEAVRVVNREIGRLLDAAAGTEAVVIITSDHGNVEELMNPRTGEPETQHDPNPVPFYLVGPEFRGKKFVNWRSLANEPLGILSDVAPTVLELMAIPKPAEMTGESLLKNIISGV